eukprot:scaffold7936_cov116-Isochrysis_galbana.AAC.10
MRPEGRLATACAARRAARVAWSKARGAVRGAWGEALGAGRRRRAQQAPRSRPMRCEDGIHGRIGSASTRAGHP